MKTFMSLLCLFTVVISTAQTEEEQVKLAVNTFFEAFHARNAEGMQKWIHTDAQLRRTAPDSTGVQVLREQRFEALINGIASMPITTVFEEKLLSYAVQIDGPLAHVWTPYEFWLDNKMHHAGANSIQLFKEDGVWKIIYLVDSRTTEGSE